MSLKWLLPYIPQQDFFMRMQLSVITTYAALVLYDKTASLLFFLQRIRTESPTDLQVEEQGGTSIGSTRGL